MQQSNAALSECYYWEKPAANDGCTSGVRYLVTDHLGSPRAITDSAGTIVKKLDYDAFGNVISDSSPSFNIPFGFAGGLYDRDTGLVRFGFRDYDSDTGRWTARDPIGFGGGTTNLYGYTANDPINFVDSTGLIGLFGQFTGQTTTIGASGSAGIISVVGTEGTSVQAQTVVQGNFTPIASGLSIGRGPGSGFFITDVSRFLDSNVASLDSPIGGLQLFFDKQGFVGVGINGPSKGLSTSISGKDFGLSEYKKLFGGELFNFQDWLNWLLNRKSCKK